MGLANRYLQVSNMHEIKNDAFYDFIRSYDSDIEYHFAGEVDYHLLKAISLMKACNLTGRP